MLLLSKTVLLIDRGALVPAVVCVSFCHTRRRRLLNKEQRKEVKKKTDGISLCVCDIQYYQSGCLCGLVQSSCYVRDEQQKEEKEAWPSSHTLSTFTACCNCNCCCIYVQLLCVPRWTAEWTSSFTLRAPHSHFGGGIRCVCDHCTSLSLNGRAVQPDVWVFLASKTRRREDTHTQIQKKEERNNNV